MDFVAELEPVKDLGQGAFGLVRLCKDRVHGEVAAKYFFRSNFTDAKDWQAACGAALREAQNLKTLEHDNVVRIIQVLQSMSGDEFLMVMEYCALGSAKKIAESNSIDLNGARRIARDAALGLTYIHEKGYLHRDIKPDNILIGANNRAKVGDFGFVTDALALGLAGGCGTPCYLAPEVPSNLACSAQTDVYSLGVTFMHLLHGDLWCFNRGRGALFDWNEPFPPLHPRGIWLPHVPASWKACVGQLTRTEVARRVPSMGGALNLISRLPAAEEWVCDVSPDLVSWRLEVPKQRRVVRVEWERYFQKGERWRAWSEGPRGERPHSLGRSAPGAKVYRELQSFFAERHARLTKP